MRGHYFPQPSCIGIVRRKVIDTTSVLNLKRFSVFGVAGWTPCGRPQVGGVVLDDLLNLDTSLYGGSVAEPLKSSDPSLPETSEPFVDLERAPDESTATTIETNKQTLPILLFNHSDIPYLPRPFLVLSP